MTRMRLRSGILAVITIIAVSAGSWVVSRPHHDARTSVSQGLDLMPADTRVTGFTDWAQIREILGFDDASGAISLADLTETAFQRELSARSILADGAEMMDTTYGWSVADLRWESYGQATEGSVVAAGMADDLTAKTVTDGLAELGYTKSGDIWTIDELEAGAPGQLASIAILESRRTMVMSKSAPYLRSVLKADRSRETLAGVPAARQTVTALAGAPSVLLERGKDACEASGFADQPADVRTRARNAVEPLGTLHEVSYAGRSIYDDGDDQQMRFSLTFDTAAEASRQLTIRKELTQGEFIGRTGAVDEVLALTSAGSDGPTATLGFDFSSDRDSFMSVAGPVLFAACSD